MDRKEIRTLYPEPKNQIALDTFIAYCSKMDADQKSTFMQKLSNAKLVELYKRVESEGLEFDGRHITLQSTGISYDYVAYKNKMLMAYPETLIDTQLVKEDDIFAVTKNSGTVNYTHQYGNPFGNSKVIGGYCIIKNKRGEFITTLNESDFEKHKKVAKTDMIWKFWPDEMKLKTLIKKAVKVHFDDIYKHMESDELGQYDLSNLKSNSKMLIEELQEIEDEETFLEWIETNKLEIKKSMPLAAKIGEWKKSKGIK